MAAKRTPSEKARTTSVAVAKTNGRKRSPTKVAADGDLNPDRCYYDPAKGTMVLGLDVFDGVGWETVLVKFGVLMPDEVEWLERLVAEARAAVLQREEQPRKG